MGHAERRHPRLLLVCGGLFFYYLFVPSPIAWSVEVEVLASDRDDIARMQIDGDYLYFVENVQLTLDTGHVRRIPKAGGAVETLAIFDDFSYSTDRTTAGHFQISGGTIYGEYGGYWRGVLYSLPVTGGTPSTLLQVADGLSFLGIVNGEVFYMSDWTHINRYPSTRIASGYYVRGRTADDSHMFFCGVRMDRSGEVLTVLPSFGFEDSVFVDSVFLFHNPLDGSRIDRVPKAGGGVSTLISGSGIRGLGSDGVYFYFREDAMLRRIPVLGGTVRDIVDAPLPVSSLVIEGETLFFVQHQADSTTSIARLDMASSSAGQPDYAYSYDSLDRLGTVSPGNGIQISYQYDSAGNRLQKCVYSQLVAQLGGASPPSRGGANNEVDVPILQLQLDVSSDEDIILKTLTFSTGGTGDEATDVGQARLWVDTNGDGQVDLDEPQLGSTLAIIADNGILTFGLLGATLPAGACSNLVLTYTLNGTASQGETFTASLLNPTDIVAYGADSVKAICPFGTPVVGNVLTVSMDTIPPVFGGIESATAGNQEAMLRWQAAAADSPVTYLIWQQTEPFGGAVAGEPAYTTTNLAHTVTGLANGQAYFFVVRAQDMAGNTDNNVTETFAIPASPLYKLSLNEPAYGRVLSEPNQFVYEADAIVSLIPEGNPGYVFSGWSGDVPAGQEAASPLSLTMDSDKAIQAFFGRAHGTVNIETTTSAAPWSFIDGDGVQHSGDGSASVAGIPTGDITLTWEPLAGYDAPPQNTKALLPSGTVTFSGTYVPEVIFSEMPQPQRYYVGETASFSVTVVGGLEPLHYAWRKASGGTVGANQTTFTIPEVQLEDVGSYSCEVTDAQPTTRISNSAQLEVAERLLVVHQPRGGYYDFGDAHTFSVEVAGGFAPLRYRWKKGETVLSTSSTFSIEKLTVQDSGAYCVEISDDKGDTITSEEAVLDVQITVPALRGMGLALLVALCVLGGLIFLKRRDKEVGIG